MARTDLPAGTVTLLFADVEGSTRLLSLLGDRFGPARARMRELVRDAAHDHEGAEVDWAGDGVFLTFRRAHDAIAAAAAIQRALAAEPWPDDVRHRLRIGIHTGEPDLGEEGYVGMDVVVAARVCSAAHGEQVVVTRQTRDMAGSEPLPGASFRPLGRHRLKDVPAAVELFQLAAPALRDEFPPLKTLSATSLPALHHRLVGRADELARVEALLAAPETRLVTIAGPGGAGKSRLALEVAARAALDRPVHLVGLAPVTDPELVPSAIARAIGARERAGRTTLEAVADNLGGTSALLFLDNLEHLAPAATHVATLLDRSPDLQVLATSRTPLHLSTENVHQLTPLSVDDATTLFLELAAARGVLLHDDALAAVHEICRRLDGLPLAIELVAARLAVLPPAEILRALGEGLALEMEGPVDLPERQRTLRAAIDWSYERLTTGQRHLHGALAVFADSGSLDDARTIAGAGPSFLRELEALVGWSLIRSESVDGELRLSMLETVREHALERLRAAGELAELQRRHAERYLALALEAESRLAGREQVQWRRRLERESDNLTAAIEWFLASQRPEDALRATNALERFWRAEGRLTEAKRWLSLGLEYASGLPPDVRAMALRSSAHMAMGQSDWEDAASQLEEAVALFRASSEEFDEVIALSYLSFVSLRLDDVDTAASRAHEALRVAQSVGDERAVASALMALADVDWVRGDFDPALMRYDEAVALSRRVGDPLLVVDAIYNSGMAAFQAGERERARTAFTEALEIGRDLHEIPHIAAAHFMLAQLAVLSGDAARAREHGRESLDLYTELEDDRSCARCLVVLAGAAVASGEHEDAARLIGAASTLRRDDDADAFETAVLGQYGRDLARALGGPVVATLQAQGAALGRRVLRAEVVAAGTEE
jgi:predicted ATPase/class 3 adenylate cyclase